MNKFVVLGAAVTAPLLAYPLIHKIGRYRVGKEVQEGAIKERGSKYRDFLSVYNLERGFPGGRTLEEFMQDFYGTDQAGLEYAMGRARKEGLYNEV